MDNNGATVFTRKNVIRAIVVLLIFSIVVLGLAAAANLYERYYGNFDGDIQGDVGGNKTVEYNGKTYVFKSNIETFLLVGLDAFGKAEENDSYNNDRQADLLMLFILDRENKTCYAVHINRDTMTDVTILGVTGQKVGTTVQQIALSHTYGNGGVDSCRNVAVAVSNLMCGVPIDNYLSLTMDGIMRLNDLVGGVTLTAVGDFTGVDDTIVEGEEITLLGEHALNYVRSRHDGPNEKRMERQRQYMQALYLKSMDYVSGNADVSADVIASLNEYAVTNCNAAAVSDMLEKMTEYEFVEIKTIRGESVLGEQYMEFNCDENALKALVVELCCEPKK